MKPCIHVPSYKTQTCRQGGSWRICPSDTRSANRQGEPVFLFLGPLKWLFLTRAHVTCQLLLTNYYYHFWLINICVQVIGSRGNNLHEAVTALGKTFLVSMPTKFRKNIWIKRGKSGPCAVLHGNCAYLVYIYICIYIYIYIYICICICISFIPDPILQHHGRTQYTCLVVSSLKRQHSSASDSDTEPHVLLQSRIMQYLVLYIT